MGGGRGARYASVVIQPVYRETPQALALFSRWFVGQGLKVLALSSIQRSWKDFKMMVVSLVIIKR